MPRTRSQPADTEPDTRGGLATRLAIGGAVAFGALASGFLASRRGRRLVAETFRGTQRGPLADRVLDRLLDDPVLRRRRLDATEQDDGAIHLIGAVATDVERGRALDIAASIPGVAAIRDHLVLDPTLRRRHAR